MVFEAAPEINFKYNQACTFYQQLTGNPSLDAKTREKTLNSLTNLLEVLKRNCTQAKKVYRRRDYSTYQKLENASRMVENLACRVEQLKHPSSYTNHVHPEPSPLPSTSNHRRAPNTVQAQWILMKTAAIELAKTRLDQAVYTNRIGSSRRELIEEALRAIFEGFDQVDYYHLGIFEEFYRSTKLRRQEMQADFARQLRTAFANNNSEILEDAAFLNVEVVFSLFSEVKAIRKELGMSAKEFQNLIHRIWNNLPEVPSSDNATDTSPYPPDDVPLPLIYVLWILLDLIVTAICLALRLRL